MALALVSRVFKQLLCVKCHLDNRLKRAQVIQISVSKLLETPPSKLAQLIISLG